jgi:hypothetical protein
MARKEQESFSTPRGYIHSGSVTALNFVIVRRCDLGFAAARSSGRCYAVAKKAMLFRQNCFARAQRAAFNGAVTSDK